MIETFGIIFFGIICILVLLVARQKYYAYALVIILAMNIVGNVMLWLTNTSKKMDSRLQKIESISNNVRDTVYAIDRIGNSTDTVIKGAKNAEDVLDNVDKTIEDKYRNLVNRLWGKKE